MERRTSELNPIKLNNQMDFPYGYRNKTLPSM